MSDRVILAVKFTPAGNPAKVRKAVGGFLRYIQHRDKHSDSEPVAASDPRVSGLLKYVAFRDQAVSGGRLFGPGGPAGNLERRELADFVTRSLAGTRPRLVADGKGRQVDRRRAVYRFMLSPEHAAGLDLRRLTEAAVGRLETEAGGPLQWIAAEHRNTAHPHVHLILAAYREVSAGHFRQVVVSRRRLAAMKDELSLEIARQRETGREGGREKAAGLQSSTGQGRRLSQPDRFVWPRPPAPRPPRRTGRDWSALPPPYASAFIRLQAVAHRYQRLIEREAEEDRLRRLREMER